MAVPPVVTSPPDTLLVQPKVPDVLVSGIGSFVPSALPDSTPDAVYAGEVDLAVEQFRASTTAAVASAEIQERYYRDGVDWYTSLYATSEQAYAQRYSADRQLEAEVLRLNTVPAGELQLQTNDLATRVQIANINSAASNYSADRDYSASILATNQKYAADIYQADQNLIASKYGSDQELAGKTFVASANKDAQVIQSTNELTGRLYESDKRYASDIYGADKQYAGTLLHENSETARLTTKLNYADSKFNIVYPVVQASLSASQTTTTPGLKSWPDLPFISTAGVLTPAQIQQQVNAAWARNDSRTQAQILQTQRELAGRGFSSNSPLLEALKVGYIGQNFRANNDAATSIRIQSAQANAQQILEAQKAVADQFNSQQGVVLESEKNQVTRQVGLVGALAQLIGGIT